MNLNSKAFNLRSTDKYSGELIFTYGEQLIRPLQEMTQILMRYATIVFLGWASKAIKWEECSHLKWKSTITVPQT